ncbi:MAG: CBS domain-containing protein [Pseudanabaena sp. M090S1SP1A06QC]|jgi:tRNA nucleotidyltransferase (CCA-adding enzyme)|nr:CBS domain-containing protein [Pseudanabaena sp. M051S1SP1A06QC]MCA6588891.1 CBS domain-containing protein [Pseudanabaena sp. M109S1SP1A06QC]MCA6606006.1 CBS domain-containing protein [Pseudanabaena sp. M007S1SP1A06QC]MCA6616212.1 CBS domain-containing protein [Pseudanabaena sp. M090S1SP1A06QC]MCA6621345.1 CBS domain-containing protein [Pseudanabaena sp. M165S2SP1A06QC]MCE2977297.1 CBS domain-containing protein [Pseudanabaena sp. CoA8_M7]
MDIILCHATADFDTLGAAVGAARLYQGARIVLTGGMQMPVREFLSLHRDEYPLIEMRSVHPEAIRRLILVDTQFPSYLGNAAKWLELPNVEIHVYDHHPTNIKPSFQPTLWCVEAVGSTCTLIIERLQAQAITLTPFEVIALALGLHVDTGSLTFEHTTPRDAIALAWLMQQGVNLRVLSTYIDYAMSPPMQEVLSRALAELPNHTETIEGYRIAVWSLHYEHFLMGLSNVVEHLMELIEVDILMVVAWQVDRISLIGRSRHEFAQLHTLMQRYGGGGHAWAASASLKVVDANFDLAGLVADIKQILRDRLPKIVTASALMSSPVRTIRPEATIDDAQRVLLRYGHSGLSVVNELDQLVGVISRRDLDIALHHGFGHAPVKGYMATTVRAIAPETSLSEIQDLMLKWDIGRLPVVDRGNLVGIVTRTDVLRYLHRLAPEPTQIAQVRDRLQVQLQKLLTPRYWDILQQAAKVADALNLQLYLVGGTVRDFLLNLATDDLDLVVDGNHPLVTDGNEPEGWGVKLARSLQAIYPDTKLEIHGKFQTSALTWADGLWIDIATARTEFYPYPAALPEVAASSIQQDLYRRDFTINALALQLNGAQSGQILDFFGGLEDLEHRTIRVLHPNSFIEDPTRIIRAVRFAVRLGFQIDQRTREYAQTASHLVQGYSRKGIWSYQNTRLKQEFHYVLTANYWVQALYQLDELGALHYLHPSLTITPKLIQQLQRVGAWLYHFAKFYPEIDRHHLWQVRLEMMLAPFTDAVEIAERLHFNQVGLRRLANFSALRDHLLRRITDELSASQVVRLLEHHNVLEIIMVAVIATSHIRKVLYRYLRDWNLRKMPLGGAELKRMGYKPSKQYQVMLGALRDRVLDGEIGTVDEAKAFINQQFPL